MSLFCFVSQIIVYVRTHIHHRQRFLHNSTPRNEGIFLMVSQTRHTIIRVQAVLLCFLSLTWRRPIMSLHEGAIT